LHPQWDSYALAWCLKMPTRSGCEFAPSQHTRLSSIEDPTWTEDALSMPFDLFHRGGIFGSFSAHLLDALVAATGFDRNRLGLIYLITEAVALKEREAANTSSGTPVQTEEHVLLQDGSFGITMHITMLEGYNSTPRDDANARRSVEWANGWIERTLQIMADHVDWEKMSRDVMIDAAELRKSRLNLWRSIARAVMGMSLNGQISRLEETENIEDPIAAALGTAYCEQEVQSTPHPDAFEVVRRGMLALDTPVCPEPCAICLQGLSAPGMECPSAEPGWAERVSQLTCGHQFHSTCILSQLHTSRNCPICRAHAEVPAHPLRAQECLENPFRIKRRRVE